jgi:hypothetical protein
MGTENINEDGVNSEASPNGPVVSAIKGLIEAVQIIVFGFFYWLVVLGSALAGIALWLLGASIPLAIAIFLALWAYKTFLAD